MIGRFKVARDYLAMLFVWGALVLLFGLLSENFLTIRTFATLANRIPPLTVIAVGMTLVLIIGGIDLSVGSLLGLSGAVLGVALADWNWPLLGAAALCLSVGLAAGAVNGLVSVSFGIPSFIVTLGMLEIARGLAYLTTNSQTMYLGERVETLARALPQVGVSTAFLLALLIVAVGQLLLSRTVIGRYLIAIGTNEQAVRLAGINTRWPKVAVFSLVGLLTGLGALFYTARLGSADPNAGVGMELSAIAAVVIGGTSLMGGRGGVGGTVVGVFIFGYLSNILNLRGVSSEFQAILKGVIIVLAVLLQEGILARWIGEAYRTIKSAGGSTPARQTGKAQAS
jgi:ribose transport system permease protein